MFPVLWLCGPSGVGKSSVGWEIHQRIGDCAYLDADQLGLCVPAPDGDPANHRLKAANLAAVWPTFRAAGARCLVVSGRLETARVARGYRNAAAGTGWTLCPLRVGERELRDRVARRGVLTHLADDAVREAAAMDRADFADLCVDTGGRTVAAAATAVLDRWPG